MAEELRLGTLYVVSTPNGNLEDVSRRAARILADVDLIAAEDTRTTGILLNHLSVRTPMISYYSHNEARRVPELLARLRGGARVAVVTDAGTPGISDPAYLLIREAVAAGIGVIAVPGPSAVLAALVASGLPTDRFVFEGFLPLKKGRRTRWEQLRGEERTIVLYEAPQRVARALEEVKGMTHDVAGSAGRQTVDSEEIKGTVDSVTSMAERIFNDMESRQDESGRVVKELEQMRASAQ